MQPKRFVNLNKAPAYVQDPRGVTVAIRSFREALDDQLRKSDGLYVVEGDFWEKYVSGTAAGPLHHFPQPRGFGRESFPALTVHYRDGRPGDGEFLTDGSPRTPVAAQAVPGRYRVAGDVITKQGKIRRRNPETGEDEEVEDTPANRTVLKPVNEPGPPPEQLRKSIIDYLEEKQVSTLEQFNQLTDEQLIAIPGMHPNALPQVRDNMRKLFKAIEDARQGSEPADTVSTEQDVLTQDEGTAFTDEEEEETIVGGRGGKDDPLSPNLDEEEVDAPAVAKPKPKPKPKVKVKVKARVKPPVKKGGSPAHPNRRELRGS